MPATIVQKLIEKDQKSCCKKLLEALFFVHLQPLLIHC